MPSMTVPLSLMSWLSNVGPIFTKNCPTCGLPGLLNLKHDDKKVLDIIDAASTTKQRLESISAPIRRLPRDVLLEIFSLCRRGFDSPLYGRDYLWTLGHICHWWRDIVHSLPTLWSVVVLYPPYNPKITEMHLQRSGDVPLHVYIIMSIDNSPPFVVSTYVASGCCRFSPCLR
ncbi:hypothetical protein EV421DRAFT_364465 [Armillaria borealis]|uniref:F-box domain-containing protein n=1 Tax=Armillaria borealis TaxID=47425 RepID=A0AA39MSZ9_9AGAR|nr:hypothetical protein EV421DRAFT_364465 [Armillaria borealis]